VATSVYGLLELADVAPLDLEWVDRTIDGGGCTRRWSLRGLTPPLDLLDRLLWEGVVLQQAIRRDGLTVGLLQLVNLDLQNGHAELAVLIAAPAPPGWTSSAAAFVQRAFGSFPLRKLSLHCVPGELVAQEALGAGCERVGVFRRHLRRGGDVFADVDVFELWVDHVPGC
jgi:hypothetical protein